MLPFVNKVFIYLLFIGLTFSGLSFSGLRFLGLMFSGHGFLGVCFQILGVPGHDSKTKKDDLLAKLSIISCVFISPSPFQTIVFI